MARWLCPARLTIYGVALGLLAGCSGKGGEDPQVRPCANSTRSFAFPSPSWGAGNEFQDPAGDRAAEVLEDIRPEWRAQLNRVSGWPRLLTVVIPLSQEATRVDAAGIALFGRSHGDLHWTPVDLPLSAVLMGGGRSLVVKPEDPIPAGLDEALVVVEPGAVEGAVALAVCGQDGTAHPAYAQAEEALPDGTQVELALPIALSADQDALPALWRRLSAEPVLAIGELQPVSVQDFGERSPPPQVAALLAPTAARGLLELPDYRDSTGTIQLAADGAPAPAGITRPGIVVALPATGQAPHPFVLFQHGGSQDKADFFLLAGPLAEAGFAFVAIDLPYHGDRAAPGGGNDMDILDFDDLLHTRDNFRQASADHMAVLSGIETLNQTLEPILGVPRALDPQRAFYMGLSMGGMTGSLTFAAVPDLDAAALFVGAAGFSELVRFGFFSLFVNDILQLDPLEVEVVLGLAEVLLDAADPLAYAQQVEDRTVAPRPVVFFQAVDEAIVANGISDLWARAFGADLVRPAHHPVAGMAELDLPVSANFTWPGDPRTTTRVLIQNPMQEFASAERHGALIVQDYSQQQVSNCFAGLLTSDICLVIDTGFSEH